MLGITTPLVTMALALACGAQADLQLVQVSVYGPAADAPAGEPQERARAAGRPTEAPTPAPTLESGAPCTCDAAGCGVFPYMDLDGDGCLFLGESEKVEQFKGHFDELDADGDGCMTQAECANSSLSEGLPSFPIAAPDECTYGYFFSEGTSVCQVCTTGETRRRRSEACTECPSGKDDLGDFDQCIGGVYLTGPIERGADNVFINKDEDESGVVLVVGDTITMSTRNPGHFERLVITGKAGFDDGARLSPEHEVLLRTRGPFFVLDHGVNEGFGQFDAMLSSCSATNGMDLSTAYPCGCGIAICESGYKCDEECGANANNTLIDGYAGTGFGTGGCCIGPPPAVMPTPVPTVAARGDPHLVNLQGEHFDVNHGGEFILLRIPQNAAMPAEVELKATILPEHGKPCTTYITEVEISGSWLKGKVVQVRSYLRSHAQNTTDKFLGLRVLSDGAPAEAPWEKIDQWTDQAYVLASPVAASTTTVTLSKTQWYSRKQVTGGAPNVAGQVEVHLQAGATDESATFVIRQDLPGQEHLNLALRRLSALGRADVGGLLGFDKHPESLEDVTPECQRHRDGLDQDRGPHSQKGWKTRWEKIKAQRGEAHDPDDNEATASLVGSRDMMCVCSNEDPSNGFRQDISADGLIDDAGMEGVVVEFQTGRLAEATWD